MLKKLNNKILVIALGGVLIFFTVVFHVDRTLVVHDIVHIPPNPFTTLQIEAKSVLVWDVSKQEILFEKHGQAQLPLASLTKLMTAYTALSHGQEDEIITIALSDLLEEGDHGLLLNETWPLEALAQFSLLSSSNDAAHALASVVSSNDVFVDAMNREASNLHLDQTYFLNTSGLDTHETLSGAYGSAYDVARLMEHILENYPEIISVTKQKEATLRSKQTIHQAENTNQMVHAFPGLIASKTGFTDLAGGNLALSFEAGPLRPLVIVVLGSSKEGRFEDVEKLMWASLEAL